MSEGSARAQVLGAGGSQFVVGLDRPGPTMKEERKALRYCLAQMMIASAPPSQLAPVDPEICTTLPLKQ